MPTKIRELKSREKGRYSVLMTVRLSWVASCTSYRKKIGIAIISTTLGAVPSRVERRNLGPWVFWACTKNVGNFMSHENSNHVACAPGRNASKHRPTSSEAQAASRSKRKRLFRPRMREPDSAQLDQLPNVYFASGSRILHAQNVSPSRAQGVYVNHPPYTSQSCHPRFACSVARD